MTWAEADAAYQRAYLQGNEQAMIAYGALRRMAKKIEEMRRDASRPNPLDGTRLWDNS